MPFYRKSVVRVAYALACHLGPGITFFLEHLPMLIPARRLIETGSLLAFEHPTPSYPIHILIVPRRFIAGLSDVQPDDSSLLGEVFLVVQCLVASLGLQDCGYRLIVNGGKYQEFPQLHFHLVSEGAGS